MFLGVINHSASPLAYSSGIPAATSYSNIYNSPIFRSAPYYPSSSPLSYNAFNPISYPTAPLPYNNGYGISPLAYNAPAFQPFVSPILRNPYIRSFPYPLY